MSTTTAQCPQCRHQIKVVRKGHSYYLAGHHRKKGGQWQACPGQGLEVPAPKGHSPADSTSATTAGYNPDSPTSTR